LTESGPAAASSPENGTVAYADTYSPKATLNGSTDSEEAHMKFALHFALLFLAFTFPARAHDIEYDTSAICDTQNQAQRLAMLDDDEQAIAMVNAEEGNPGACAVETVAFVRGAILGTARSKADAFAIVEILVVGVDRESGFRSIAPNVYFMLVKIDERDA
jgi:hypothetical protein